MEKSMLKENAVHGTNAYPYAVYQWEGDGELPVPLHWHKETEIIFLKEGSFTFSINMKEYYKEAPALIFIGSGEIHSILIKKGMKENAVVFDLGMLSFENYDGIQYKIIRPLIEGEISFPQIITKEDTVWEEAFPIYEKIFLEAAKKELSAYLQVKAGLYELLACFYQEGYLKNIGEVSEKDSEKIDILKKVLTYIHENYAERLTVEEIASVAGMNAQYFCRYFKKNISKTVTEYINDIRISHAAQKLERTNDKIIDIAGQCGYDNVGYFIKRFRQCKGMSPSEYRKSI